MVMNMKCFNFRSRQKNNNHPTLLNKHLDYTRRCDKCKNWVPMHQSNMPLDPVEWDGHYCEHVNHNFNHSQYVGYSKMLEELINDLMERFVYEAFGEIEFKRAVTFCANICPLYDEMEIKYKPFDPLGNLVEVF